VLGLVVALLTGDARFVLVKDYLVTFVIALAALGTLGLWVVGLIGEVAVAVAVIYTTPLAVVVIVTGVLTPVVLLSLIAVTQVRAGRAHGEASSTPHLS